MIKKQPKEITACYLECVLMPNGEIISLGVTIGWFWKYKDYLTPWEELKNDTDNKTTPA